nr:putative reverse transcriptase domain-containing protein [Tanacetum cinerariifolium]
MHEVLGTRLDRSTAYHPQTDGQKSVVHQLSELRLEKKGVVRFRKKGKLVRRFVGPFEIIEKIGLVAYMLDLPEELDGVHDMFHVSILKKCLANPTLEVPLDEIQVDAKLNFVEEPVEILDREFKKLKRSRISIIKLNFVEEPVEILDREFKKLKRSRISIIKVRWNSKRGPEFTWEREDQMKLKYRICLVIIVVKFRGRHFLRG